MPRAILGNTNTIQYVMKNGRLYEGDTLDEVWPRQRPLEGIYWWNEARGESNRLKFGWADRDRSIPADTGTIYRVGSISKSFAAVAMAQSAAEGVFDLDERLSDYLPERLIRRSSTAMPGTTLTFL